MLCRLNVGAGARISLSGGPPICQPKSPAAYPPPRRTIMAEHFGSLALPVGEFLALEHGTGEAGRRVGAAAAAAGRQWPGCRWQGVGA